MPLDPVSYFIMTVLPYVAISCFFVGVIYRVFTWIRAPTAANRFTVFPGANNKAKIVFEATKDVAFFPRILKQKKLLWLGLWALHYGLLITLAGHTRLLFEWDFIWNLLDFDKATRDTVAMISGIFAGIIVLSTVIYLLARRLSGTLAEASNFEDYFVLGMFLGIGLTGMGTRLFSHVDLDAFRTYLFSLLTLQLPVVIPDAGPFFLVHLLLVLTIVAILPFTKLFHLGGIFVTMYKSKKNPEVSSK
ncbi:MAG: respiratory nitrate reductase subunit gamma [Candidatus Hodarchaeales archaeon]|jgi:nitrate reductase gamma subunit